MKKQLLGLVFASMVMTSGFASFKQTINLCLDAAGNDTPVSFEGHFGSTDFFDRGHTTPVVSNGKACTSHEYGHGPKNIALKLKALGRNKGEVLLVPSTSCYYMANYKSDPGTLVSNYERTTSKNENWNITLTKAPLQADYKAVFYVVCEHTVAQ